ncbi:phosphosulfolactate synthase [Mastigocladopsis repens]|uniref:phosphosulfolactate synthase n=1 Tax=Mastigocladopsis repens TaxID=221287 RepID=UPI0002DFA90D|nr:phosphosulfolactate synthase [Mastigocladopsis repens]
MTHIISAENSFFQLPIRESKPRNNGLTILIDNGIPTQYFWDIVNSFSELIDLIKFGWCTSVVSQNILNKIESASSRGINFFFGGTFFEKAVKQKKIDFLYEYFKYYNCQYIEISNGIIALTNREKAKYISDFSKEFKVLSEVGYKDYQTSLTLSSEQWIEYIQEDLEAGSVKVILESRESGRSGICLANGEIRYELTSKIINSGINTKDIIFEAPNKDMQVHFIKELGANVNLANISFNDIISLETLRLGLRADTLNFFEGKEA